MILLSPTIGGKVAGQLIRLFLNIWSWVGITFSKDGWSKFKSKMCCYGINIGAFSFLLRQAKRPQSDKNVETIRTRRWNGRLFGKQKFANWRLGSIRISATGLPLNPSDTTVDLVCAFILRPCMGCSPPLGHFPHLVRILPHGGSDVLFFSVNPI